MEHNFHCHTKGIYCTINLCKKSEFLTSQKMAFFKTWIKSIWKYFILKVPSNFVYQKNVLRNRNRFLKSQISAENCGYCNREHSALLSLAIWISQSACGFLAKTLWMHGSPSKITLPESRGKNCSASHQSTDSLISYTCTDTLTSSGAPFAVPKQSCDVIFQFSFQFFNFHITRVIISDASKIHFCLRNIFSWKF